jgi:putative SOS response-associated peptidase YedK
MCGRFTQCYSWEEVHRFLSVVAPAAPPNLRPRYNIAPTTMVDVIVDRGKGRELVQMRWGIVPPWSKPDAKDPTKPESKFATFNARSEEVEEKATFRGAWKAKRRCIIPASGFFEWTGQKGDKTPHYFTRVDGKIIGFAGLWEVWKNRATGEDLYSCSILIHEPSRWMAKYHNRMPAILEEKDFDGWLRGEVGKEALKPAPTDVLKEWIVSSRVNKTGQGDDDPTIIDSVVTSDEAALPEIPKVPGEPYDGSPI